MAVITAQTVVLRGKTILADGSRFETRGGNDAVIGYLPAFVSVRHLNLGCKQQSYGQHGQPRQSQLSLAEPMFAGVLCRKPADAAGGVVDSRRPHATATPWQRHCQQAN
jgi:hypothetical protein